MAIHNWKGWDINSQTAFYRSEGQLCRFTPISTNRFLIGNIFSQVPGLFCNSEVPELLHWPLVKRGGWHDPISVSGASSCFSSVCHLCHDPVPCLFALILSFCLVMKTTFLKASPAAPSGLQRYCLPPSHFFAFLPIPFLLLYCIFINSQPADRGCLVFLSDCM